jgi:hypothetical protein
MLINDNFYL